MNLLSALAVILAISFLLPRTVRIQAIEMGHEEIVMANGPMAGKPLNRQHTNIRQKTGDEWMQIARQATYVGIDGDAVYGHPDLTPGRWEFQAMRMPRLTLEPHA